jgi:hypothetical protein
MERDRKKMEIVHVITFKKEKAYFFLIEVEKTPLKNEIHLYARLASPRRYKKALLRKETPQAKEALRYFWGKGSLYLKADPLAK